MGRIKISCFLIFLTQWAMAQSTVKVYFEFDSAQLQWDAQNLIKTWNLNHPNTEIVSIQGYCDDKGSSDYNQTLAQERIDSVMEFLILNNVIISDTIQIVAKGKDFKQHEISRENRNVTLIYQSIPENETIEDIKVEIPEIELKTDTYQTTPADFEKQLSEALMGEKVPLYDFQFEFNSAKMIPASVVYLEVLLKHLEANPSTKIRILGHMCCNRNATTKLSEKRAKFIFEYLIKSNISKERLTYQGMGITEPIFKIPEANMQQQKINRRVEIEITNK